ncbi:MAG: metallophosphoesterase [Thermoleophilia bacterium]|nr:metallophosphoesterase [Thermoleophilia bacterium]
MKKHLIHTRLVLVLLLASVILATGSACGIAGESRNGPAETDRAGSSTIGITAPSATDEDSFTFAVAGDNRVDGIEGGVLGRIIDSAKSRGAAFMVNTGDISTSGTREELTLYRDHTEASGLKSYPVIGNHDLEFGESSQTYTEVIGPTYYSFDYANSHFILLDNADDRQGVDAAQMEWYIADLDASADATNTFIFTHIPVAGSGLASDHVAGEKGPAGLESGRAAAAEAARHPNVRAFFFGHIHGYASYRLNGIDAYVTGGAGAPLTHLPEEAGGYYHYLLVTVRGEQVDVEVVRI